MDLIDGIAKHSYRDTAGSEATTVANAIYTVSKTGNNNYAFLSEIISQSIGHLFAIFSVMPTAYYGDGFGTQSLTIF